MSLHCKPGRTEGGRRGGEVVFGKWVSERNTGGERDKREKLSTRTSDDGFVTDCYITGTSENNF